MGNRNILLYMAFVFLSNFSTILYFLTVYLQFVGFSLVSISSMLLAYQVSKFLLEMPTGYISDKFGRKSSGMLGMVGMLAFYLALMTIRNPAVMVAAFVLKGLALALLSGSFEAIYIDSVPRGALVRLNVVERFVFYSAYALSAYLGGWISVSHAYRLGLVCDIVAMALALAVVLFMRETKTADDIGGREEGAFVRNAAKSIAGNSVLIAAYLMDASQAFAFVALEDYFAMMLGERGMDSVAAGLTVAVQLLVSAAIGFIVPSVIDKLDGCRFTRGMACIRLFLTAGFLLPVTPTSLLPALYVMQTVAYALFAPIKYSIFQNSIDPLYRCSLISVQSQMISVGAIAFYLFNTLACGALGLDVRTTLLIALMLSAFVYVPALFRLTKSRSGDGSAKAAA